MSSSSHEGLNIEHDNTIKLTSSTNIETSSTNITIQPFFTRGVWNIPFLLANVFNWDHIRIGKKTKYENSNQSHFNKPQQPAHLIDGYPVIKQHRYGTSPFFHRQIKYKVPFSSSQTVSWPDGSRVNGHFRILKWRYCTLYRSYIWNRYLQSIGSWRSPIDRGKISPRIRNASTRLPRDMPTEESAWPWTVGRENSNILVKVYGYNQWIGLRENLQETMVFTIKYRSFL